MNLSGLCFNENIRPSKKKTFVTASLNFASCNSTIKSDKKRRYMYIIPLVQNMYNRFS